VSLTWGWKWPLLVFKSVPHPLPASDTWFARPHRRNPNWPGFRVPPPGSFAILKSLLSVVSALRVLAPAPSSPLRLLGARFRPRAPSASAQAPFTKGSLIQLSDSFGPHGSPGLSPIECKLKSPRSRAGVSGLSFSPAPDHTFAQESAENQRVGFFRRNRVIADVKSVPHHSPHSACMSYRPQAIGRFWPPNQRKKKNGSATRVASETRHDRPSSSVVAEVVPVVVPARAGIPIPTSVGSR